MQHKPILFIFGWPSFLGGTDTKLAHLVTLLKGAVDVTVVPNSAKHLEQKTWVEFLLQHEAKSCLLEDIPAVEGAFGLAMCNDSFFVHRIAHRAKDKGLRIIWSSEMMWHHPGELEAIRSGIVDQVVYTSEVQKKRLSPEYGSLPVHLEVVGDFAGLPSH